jgi:site-specific DNA recombinase
MTRTPTKTIRCAIYTRKSTEEGLQQEFNTLDAQYECGAAYVKSLSHEGYVLVANRYDDGGFSGGNLDRPALRRLLDDVRAGRIDMVIIYKLDRLSRSLLDFAKLMELFEKHGVTFASVTQQISTGTSMGRLMMNVLLSFAQFEREIISERTRDKIAATRRKGIWTGGYPLLGYDIDSNTKLVVNEMEAAQVRAIFELYLEFESLLPVVQELERRGWRNKSWTTRKGTPRGGKPFTRTSLHLLLKNVIYIGKLKYKTEVHSGEHLAIVDATVFDRVQSILRRNHLGGGDAVRNPTALLKGLIRCKACSCSMSPSRTGKKNKSYAYYVCARASQRGRDTCPSKSIPAGQIERYVIDRIRCIGSDPVVVRKTIDAANRLSDERTAALDGESRDLSRQLLRWHADLQEEARQPSRSGAGQAHLADLHERIRHAEQRLSSVGIELENLRHERLDPEWAAAALAGFDAVWNNLSAREQFKLVRFLIEQVTYDGATNRIAISFHASGIQSLAAQCVPQGKRIRA